MSVVRLPCGWTDRLQAELRGTSWSLEHPDLITADLQTNVLLMRSLNRSAAPRILHVMFGSPANVKNPRRRLHVKRRVEETFSCTFHFLYRFLRWFQRPQSFGRLLRADAVLWLIDWLIDDLSPIIPTVSIWQSGRFRGETVLMFAAVTSCRQVMFNGTTMQNQWNVPLNKTSRSSCTVFIDHMTGARSKRMKGSSGKICKLKNWFGIIL